MKVQTVGKLLCLLGVTTMAVAALPARAQTSPISDSFIVYNPNGGVVASVFATEADEVNNGPSYIYTIPDASLVDQSQFGNATTLLESDGSYSDIFGIASVNGGLYLAFSSDTDTQQTPYGSQGAIFLLEGNGVFDATMYLNPDLQAQGYKATFTSDADESVPDGGATGAMLGMAMLGMGWLRRKIS